MTLLSASVEFPNNIIGTIGISYPLSVLWFLSFFNSSHFTSRAFEMNKKMSLIISGTEDQFTSPLVLEKFFKDKNNVQLEIIDGCDHFWWNYESLVSTKIDIFLTRIF
jgi:pimeloyl-ACP methyl ester carboxylesterase